METEKIWDEGSTVMRIVLPSDIPTIKKFYSGNGTLFEINGEKILDAHTFTVECFAKLPNESGLGGTGSFDAFTDWLGEEFSILHEMNDLCRIGIIWRNSDALMEVEKLEDLFLISELMWRKLGT